MVLATATMLARSGFPAVPMVLDVSRCGLRGAREGHAHLALRHRAYAECSAPGPSQLLHLPQGAESMTSQEVQVYLKERLGRGLLVPGLEFSDVEVSHLGAGLPIRCGLCGPKCLPPYACPEYGLAPGLLPGFPGTRPRLFRVFFPCAVSLATRAHTPLLPDGQRDRRPARQRTGCMAIASTQVDRGLELVSRQRGADPDSDMPALLVLAPGARRAKQTRVRPRIEDQGKYPSPGNLLALPDVPSRTLRPSRSTVTCIYVGRVTVRIISQTRAWFKSP